MYDPNHPDADWSGYVPQKSSKKHPRVTPKARKDHLTTLCNGITIGPCSCAKTNDDIKSLSSKRQYPNTSKSSSSSSSSSSSNDTFSLIGGPIPNNKEDVVQPCHWETETQAFMRQKQTSIDQLNFHGRSMHVRGKKQTKPMFEQDKLSHFNPRKAILLRRENPYLLSEEKDDDDDDDDSIKEEEEISYKGNNSFNSNRSLLAGIAQKISKDINFKNPSSLPTMTPAPFATDGNLKTDPYMSFDGERRKDLALENYKYAVAGYTGKRQNFD